MDDKGIFNDKLHNTLLKKRKADGTPYRNRKDMINDYKNSKLPYPFSVIRNIDYCRTILYSHMKNSLFFALPFSFVMTYALNPKSRTEGLNFKKNKILIVNIYILSYFGIMAIFALDAFTTCDYCKPWSEFYKLNNSNDDYVKSIKDRFNKLEKSKKDIIISKAKIKGLSDEDL